MDTTPCPTAVAKIIQGEEGINSFKISHQPKITKDKPRKAATTNAGITLMNESPRAKRIRAIVVKPTVCFFGCVKNTGITFTTKYKPIKNHSTPRATQ